MVFASRVVEVFGFSRLINADCPVTSTDCEVAAGDKVKLTSGGLSHGNNAWVATGRAPNPCGMHFNPVGSRVYLGEEEASLRVALDLADGTGVYLGGLDLGIGNHRAAGVEDAAGEGAAGSALRPSRLTMVNMSKKA